MPLRMDAPSPERANPPRERLAPVNRPAGAIPAGPAAGAFGCGTGVSPSGWGCGCGSGGGLGGGAWSGTHGGTIGTPPGEPLLDCEVPTGPPSFVCLPNRLLQSRIFLPVRTDLTAPRLALDARNDIGHDLVYRSALKKRRHANALL